MRGKVTQAIFGKFFQGGYQWGCRIGVLGIIIGLILEFSGKVVHDEPRYLGNRTVQNAKPDQCGMKTGLRNPDCKRYFGIIDKEG